MTDYSAFEHINEHFMKLLFLDDGASRSRFLALALCGEVGELANMIKKEWRDGRTPLRDEAIAEEIADVAIYLHHLAQARGVDIAAEVQKKAAKLRVRWPEAFGDD